MRNGDFPVRSVRVYEFIRWYFPYSTQISPIYFPNNSLFPIYKSPYYIYKKGSFLNTPSKRSELLIAPSIHHWIGCQIIHHSLPTNPLLTICECTFFPKSFSIKTRKWWIAKAPSRAALTWDQRGQNDPFSWEKQWCIMLYLYISLYMMILYLYNGSISLLLWYNDSISI